MGLVLTTPPTIEPINLAEAKRHLRITADNDPEGSEDDLILNLIKAARRLAEVKTGRQFITATYTLTLDEFDCYEIALPRPPLQSITSVKYLDLNGVLQTLSSSVYSVDVATEPGFIRLAYDQTWPTTRAIENAVTIVFKAGYGDAASTVPESLKAAMLLHIGHLYENRESVNVGNIVTEIPMAYDSLIWAHKVPGCV